MTKKRTPDPKFQAMVLCDHLYRDGGTGKVVIAGTFTTIRGHKWPIVHQKAWVYINMVDFTREKMFLQVARLDKPKILAKSPTFDVRSKDRITPQEIAIELPPLQFDEPGRYAVELVRASEQRILNAWRFAVVEPPPKGEGQ